MVRDLFYRIGLAVATGYILFFYSERVFWSFLLPGDTVPHLILTWLIYSIAAYICLIAIHEFRVRTLWAMVIVGALFGWLIEGVFAMTLFGSDGIPFPLTISWTGLAWHALISVLIGWFFLQRALLSSFKSTVLISAGLGIFWGLWSTSWAGGPSVSDFFFQATLFTILLILAQRAYYVFSASRFTASLAEKSILAACVLVWFFFVTVPTIGILAISIPLLFLILYAALRANRIVESEQSFMTSLDHAFSWKRSMGVLGIPIMATITYGIFQTIHGGVLIHTIVFLSTTLIGFSIMAVSLWSIKRRSHRTVQSVAV